MNKEEELEKCLGSQYYFSYKVNSNLLYLDGHFSVEQLKKIVEILEHE